MLKMFPEERERFERRVEQYRGRPMTQECLERLKAETDMLAARLQLRGLGIDPDSPPPVTTEN